MNGAGRLLILGGLILIAIGALVVFSERLPFRIGRLPGDIVWKGKNTTFYFPLMTLVIVNLVLFLIFRLFNRH